MRALVSILVMFLPGCGHVPGPLQHDFVDAEYIVPRDGARSAAVQLETSGDLWVRGGACSLVEAKASYDGLRTEARADFTLDEDRHGTVVIAIEPRPTAVADTALDVCLSTELPVRLTASSGVGPADLDLSSVQLRGFTASTGGGELDVDFGDASVAAATMNIDSGTGDVTVDAKQASWTGANTLDIDVGTGDVTVYLPRGVGVRVVVDHGTGGLDVRGLQQEDGAYLNAASSSATDRLDIDIDAGVGDVTLIAG